MIKTFEKQWLHDYRWRNLSGWTSDWGVTFPCQRLFSFPQICHDDCDNDFDAGDDDYDHDHWSWSLSWSWWWWWWWTSDWGGTFPCQRLFSFHFSPKDPIWPNKIFWVKIKLWEFNSRYHECTLGRRWEGASLLLSLLKTSKIAKMSSGKASKGSLFVTFEDFKVRKDVIRYYMYKGSLLRKYSDKIMSILLMGFNVHFYRKGGMLKGSNISITEDMSRWVLFYSVNCPFYGWWFSEEFERRGRNWESLSGTQKRWQQ